MKKGFKSLLAGYIAVAAAGGTSRAGTDLLQAVRNNDLATLRAAAAQNENINVRGPREVTPLIHAAAFGSVEAVKLLLDAGADVNAKDAFGVTPLILAAGDAAKAKLLIGRGADVNAKTKMGRTPLIVAAAHDGNLDTVRLLLDKRADIGTQDGEGNTALLTAAFADAFDTVKLLVERGANVKQANSAGFTPLHHAAANGNRAMMRLLLAKGADPNAANTFGGKVKFGEIALKQLTPLMQAAPHGSPADIDLLLDTGADVNARDSRGMTPLMFAVASEKPDVRIVKRLLAAGADRNSRSAAGETALDWARKYRNPEVVAALESAGAKPGIEAAGPPYAHSKTPAFKSPREAVERSVALLQRTSAEFFRQSGCVGCHHQPLTLMAVAAAREAGLAVDENAARETAKAVAANWDVVQAALLEGLDGPAPPDIQISSVFGLAAAKQPAGLVTDTLAANIASRQRRDGSWKLTGFSRAPLEESHFARTAMSLRALQLYGTPGLASNFRARVAKARKWLETAKPQTTDDYVWRLVGLHWSGSEAAKLTSAASALRRLQREDGGWAPNEHLESDAYATGTVLWALRTAHAALPNEGAYRRGVDYLMRSQQSDGSWHVKSRGPKFQPYFESGFPYGHDQWISAAATAWAAIALAPAADIAVSQSDEPAQPPRIAQGPNGADLPVNE